ncbi:MAG: VaFE repeat-containing surface-anchored protein [Clostridiales bacterium]|nr:VaFE repeat-containing surface-anchored protein [Clostridiales bacterium]
MNQLNDNKTRILSGFMAATVAVCTLPFFIEPEHAEAAVLSSNALVSEEDTRDAGYSYEKSFRNEILMACEKMDGVRYEWGGGGWNGIDCAGSVSLAYSAALGTAWIDDPVGDYGNMTLTYYGGGFPDEYGFYVPGYAGIRSGFTNGLLADRDIEPDENHFSEFETNGEDGIQSDEWINIINTYGFRPGDMIMWWNDDNDPYNAQHITIYAGIEDGVPMHWTASSSAGYFCKKPLADSSAEAGKGSFTGFMGLKATELQEEAYVGFSLEKRDPSGISYTGAVFSVYNDPFMRNKVGELKDDDMDGIYSDYHDLSGNSGYDDMYKISRMGDIHPYYEDTLFVKETTYPSGVILPDGRAIHLSDSWFTPVPSVYQFIDDSIYMIDVSLTSPDGTYGYLEYSVRDTSGNVFVSDSVSGYSYLRGSEVIEITNNLSSEFTDASCVALEKITSTGLDVTSTVFTLKEGEDTVAEYKYVDGSWNWYDIYNRIWDVEDFPVKYDTEYTIVETFDADEVFNCVDGSYINYKVRNDSDGWVKVDDTTYTFAFTTDSLDTLCEYDFTVENNIDSGRIKVIKEVADEDDTSGGFEFELWDDSETKLVATGVSSDDGNVYWQTASGNHQAFFELPTGNYVLTETVPVKYYGNTTNEYTYKIPDGFTEGNDSKWHKSIVIGEGTNTEIVTNDRHESSIAIVKTSEDNVVEDVEFEIYYGGKNAEPAWQSDSFNSGYTDASGNLEFTNLPVGWYRIDETVQPAYYAKWDDGSENGSRIVHITEADDNIEIEISVYNRIDMSPVIHTELTDNDKTHDVLCGTSVELIDTVYFENLTVGYDYTITGSLVDKKSGDIFVDESDNEYVVSVDFTADASLGEVSLDSKGREVVTGYVEVPFVIDSAYLYELAFENGEDVLSVVCFETLTFRGITIAEHNDLNDDSQTVTVSPKIRTTASDCGTGTGVLTLSEEVDIDDKVSFAGLVSGETYVVSGTLMDKATGKPYVDSEGNTYISERSFVGAPVGFVMVHFENVKVPLDDVELVVFEQLRVDGREKVIAVHEDIEDMDQTLSRPSCITYAATTRGNKAFLEDTVVTVVDQVHYENLEAGHTYYAKATLSKSDGSSVISGGYEVVSLQEFVPETKDGTVEVSITFDSSNLESGERVVVFENIYDKSTDEEIAKGLQLEDIQVLSHEDLNNMDQSLTVTELPSTGEVADYSDVILGVVLICAGLSVIGVVLFRRKKVIEE